MAWDEVIDGWNTLCSSLSMAEHCLTRLSNSWTPPSDGDPSLHQVANPTRANECMSTLSSLESYDLQCALDHTREVAAAVSLSLSQPSPENSLDAPTSTSPSSGPSSSTTLSTVEDVALRACLRGLLSPSLGLSGVEEWRSIEQRVKHVQSNLEPLKLASFLHQSSATELAHTLYHHSKGHVPYMDSGMGLPNWPGFWKFKCTTVAMVEKLNQYVSTSLVTRGLAAEEASLLIAKLESLPALVFGNAKALSSVGRTSVEEDGPALSFDISGYLPLPDVDNEPTRPDTVAYYVDRTYRTILASMGYHITHIRSDGNCFFRSIARTFFPQASGRSEASLALALRRRTNRGELNRLKVQGREEEYRYAAFSIAGINDSQIMREPGVWADHLQVVKAADLLKCTIWLFSYEDTTATIRDDGSIFPGESHRVGDHYAGQPVCLYYTSTPGHYELLHHRVHAPLRLETGGHDCRVVGETSRFERTLREDIMAIRMCIGGSEPSDDVIRPSPHQVVATYLRLEEAGSELEELVGRSRSAVGEMLQIAAIEVDERRTKLLGNIREYSICMDLLGVSYMRALERRESGEDAMFAAVLRPLVDDGMVFIDKEPAHYGDGPLSTLYKNTARHKVHIPTTSSMMTPYGTVSGW